MLNSRVLRREVVRAYRDPTKASLSLLTNKILLQVWLCGGRLLHVPCSRIGHMARVQPYSFPGGRQIIEQFNYKRAISVWMGNYSRFVYNSFPDMKVKPGCITVANVSVLTLISIDTLPVLCRNLLMPGADY